MAKRKTKAPETSAKPEEAVPAEPPSGVVRAHWDFYRLGRRVKQWRKQHDKSRESAVRAIAAEDDCSAHKVKAASYFCERFGLEELKRLGRIETEEGEPPRLTHLLELATIKDEKERREWLDRLERERWTVQDFKKQMRRRPNKPHKDRGAGRPLKRPTNPEQGLEQILNRTEEWLKHHDRHRAGEQEWLSVPEPADAETSRRMEAAVETLSRPRRAAKQLEERLAKLLEQTRQAGMGEAVRDVGGAGDEQAAIAGKGSRRRKSR